MKAVTSDRRREMVSVLESDRKYHRRSGTELGLGGPEKYKIAEVWPVQ